MQVAELLFEHSNGREHDGLRLQRAARLEVVEELLGLAVRIEWRLDLARWVPIYESEPFTCVKVERLTYQHPGAARSTRSWAILEGSDKSCASGRCQDRIRTRCHKLDSLNKRRKACVKQAFFGRRKQFLRENIPFGVLLGKAFSCEASQLQVLTFAQLANQNLWEREWGLETELEGLRSRQRSEITVHFVAIVVVFTSTRCDL